MENPVASKFQSDTEMTTLNGGDILNYIVPTENILIKLENFKTIFTKFGIKIECNTSLKLEKYGNNFSELIHIRYDNRDSKSNESSSKTGKCFVRVQISEFSDENIEESVPYVFNNIKNDIVNETNSKMYDSTVIIDSEIYKNKNGFLDIMILIFLKKPHFQEIIKYAERGSIDNFEIELDFKKAIIFNKTNKSFGYYDLPISSDLNDFRKFVHNSGYTSRSFGVIQNIECNFSKLNEAIIESISNLNKEIENNFNKNNDDMKDFIKEYLDNRLWFVLVMFLLTLAGLKFHT